jgi:hypothetical protein
MALIQGFRVKFNGGTIIDSVVALKLPTNSSLQGASPGDGNSFQKPFLGEQLAVIEIETQDIEAAKTLCYSNTPASRGTVTSLEITPVLDDGSLGTPQTFGAGVVAMEVNPAQNRTPATCRIRYAEKP